MFCNRSPPDVASWSDVALHVMIEPPLSPHRRLPAFLEAELAMLKAAADVKEAIELQAFLTAEEAAAEAAQARQAALDAATSAADLLQQSTAAQDYLRGRIRAGRVARRAKQRCGVRQSSETAVAAWARARSDEAARANLAARRQLAQHAERRTPAEQYERAQVLARRARRAEWAKDDALDSARSNGAAASVELDLATATRVETAVRKLQKVTSTANSVRHAAWEKVAVSPADAEANSRTLSAIRSPRWQASARSTARSTSRRDSNHRSTSTRVVAKALSPALRPADYRATKSVARVEGAAREVVLARLFAADRLVRATRLQEVAVTEEREAREKQEEWRQTSMVMARQMADEAKAIADAAKAREEEAQMKADDTAALYAAMGGGLLAAATALALFALAAALLNGGGHFLGPRLPLAATALAIGGVVAGLVHWRRRSYLEERRRLALVHGAVR